ncbi:hypothetical protein Enr13x_74400 [Stieleria neptunia]|uniref:TRASH transcription regulator C-terminal archaeal domain-containing protein n=1 Tax=Stieleria neptunia TaxID=2527979 RepID=A0A518I344_9BACT|nr:hypothetical protein [Stieleria neptunia]QDV47530.1 hypothetical protein Enr13x_74400 [Stieleria neptunia]
MSKGIASLALSLAFTFVFVLSGCARDRYASVGATGGGCGGSSASGASCHDTGGVVMAPQVVAQQQTMTHQPAVASGGGVINNKLCPVMGEPLGSMGDPVPVTVGGETLFVCCRGCVKKVKADPAKYFAIARNE